jgi:competence protein ComEC
MAILAIYARASHRTYDALRALAVVAFVMVLWNPFVLAFDPGFQLSGLAMLGLTLFTTAIARYIAWIPERFALREIVASTIATQITVLPLLLYQDGQLSLLALPANVLAMMPIPFAMLASCIAALCGIVFGSPATPVAFPAYATLTYVIWVAHTLAALPFSSITIPVFGVGWVVCAYVVLGSVAFLLHGKSQAH